MQMFRTAVLVIGGMMLGGAPAAAERAFYVGGSVTQIDDNDFKLDGFTTRLGWNFSKNFGVEGEATFSTGEDQQGAATFELADTYAIFGTARISPSEELELVFRTGLIDTGVDIRAPGFSDSEKRRSAAVGLHANWFLTDQIGLRGGYTYSKSNALELGVVWRF